MRQAMWRVLIAVGICGGFPGWGYGECLIGDGQGQKVTNVYFVNGMMTGADYAEVIRLRLEAEYRSLEERRPGSRYEFGVKYNPTSYSLAGDVAEVLAQKAERDGLFFSRRNLRIRARALVEQVTAGETVRGVLNWLSEAMPGFQWTPNELAEAMIAPLEEAGAALAVVDAGLVAEHAECYVTNLRQGKRVVIVAHSQGNLYANGAAEGVAAAVAAAELSVGVVGVATPDSRRANGGSGYVTAKDDVVINLLRAVPGAQVLPGNVNNELGEMYEGRDFWKHGFIRSYFEGGLRSRERIDALMRGLDGRLRFPGREVAHRECGIGGLEC